MMDASRNESNHEVVIVGSGFAGIGMGIRLRAMGIHDFVILEQAEGVGGTWRDNVYPGAACDVESLLYSFSFDQNPRWSRTYAAQAEILAYLNDVTDRYELRPHLRFRSKVARAVWNEARARWRITLEDGRNFTCKVLVTGTGGFAHPAIPSIEGQAEFRGKAFHTARWDRDVELTGKTVAVIGTGASAIQVVPAIVEKVRALKLFQRTPPWVIPKNDRAFRWFERRLFARLPFTQELARKATRLRLELRWIGFAAKPELMERPQRDALEYMDRVVADPALRAKLTPSYRVGCKRVLLSDDYFPAVQRDNVELVTDGIERITADGILTRDGVERPVDVIVYATGFNVGDAWAAPFEVLGRDGVELTELWRRDGAEAYLGTSIAGFPNFFMMTGPNSGLGHTSLVLMIEAHIQYIAGAITTLRSGAASSVSVRKDVQDRFNRWLQARLSRTIWATGGCKSWYQSASGKIDALWPDTTFAFGKRTATFDLSKYEVTAQTRRDGANPGVSEPGWTESP